MNSDTKIVVTMTSWRKRMPELGMMIYRFMTSQTVRPDIFYLWLAEAEFPNKELDLPKDLLTVCRYFNVVIKWCEYNDYCFKRWYVYPDHYADMVITIDDDLMAPPNLIETARNHIGERNISYNLFYDLTFAYDFTEPNFKKYSSVITTSVRNRFLGCSMICPYTFPLECMSDEALRIRRRYCNKEDQSYIKGFMVANHTPISSLPFKFKNCVIMQLSKNGATCNSFLAKHDGIDVWHYQLYLILSRFPNVLKAWRAEFPNFPVHRFETYGTDNIIKLLKSYNAL